MMKLKKDTSRCDREIIPYEPGHKAKANLENKTDVHSKQPLPHPTYPAGGFACSSSEMCM